MTHSDKFLAAVEKSETSMDSLGVVIVFLPYIIWIGVRTLLYKIGVFKY